MVGLFSSLVGRLDGWFVVCLAGLIPLRGCLVGWLVSWLLLCWLHVWYGFLALLLPLPILLLPRLPLLPLLLSSSLTVILCI